MHSFSRSYIASYIWDAILIICPSNIDLLQCSYIKLFSRFVLSKVTRFSHRSALSFVKRN